MDFGSFFNTKKDILVKFTAIISYLSNKKGDKTGAILLNEGIEEIIPPDKGIKQVYRITKRLLDYKSREKTVTSTNLSSLSHIIGRKKSVFFMSDFIFPDLSWKKHFGELAVKNKLTAVHIADPVEEKLPDVGYINLHDPETGKQIAFDTSNKKIVSKYQEFLNEENAKINEIFSILHLEPVKIYTNSDIADILIKYSDKTLSRR